jgi:diguanylate cyclase
LGSFNLPNAKGLSMNDRSESMMAEQESAVLAAASALSTADDRVRIADLRRLGILDTQPEERFNRIVQLACNLFNVQWAFITFVDECRQWFKAKTAQEFPGEVPRNGFCAQCILEPPMMIIPDARLDPRFCDKPYVRGTASPILYYAGHVLYGPMGHAVGTLCICDDKPRDFSPLDLEKLRSLGDLCQYWLLERWSDLAPSQDAIAQSMADQVLPDRDLFRSLLGQALLESGDQERGLTILHLLNSEAILSAHGTDGLEATMRQLGERFKRAAPLGSLLARFDLSRFALFCPPLAHSGEVLMQLTDMITQLEQPLDLDGSQFFPKFRAGTAFHPTDGPHADELMIAALNAVTGAVAGETETCVFFTHSMLANTRRRLSLEAELRSALKDDGRFFLALQPQVNAATQEIAGVEALLRLRGSDGGLIAPADFIPIAEELGLVTPIGEKVFQMAAEIVRRHLDAGAMPPPLAINVSERQFRMRRVVEPVCEMLTHYGIPPHLLRLEITESVMVAEPDLVIAQMRQLSNLGVETELDDFGTGYSSLSYLKRLPITAVKLDRSFIADIQRCRTTYEIVKAVINLCQALDLRTLAEGIETADQSEALLKLGCYLHQGYHFYRPVTVERYERLLAEKGLLLPLVATPPFAAALTSCPINLPLASDQASASDFFPNLFSSLLGEPGTAPVVR